MNETTFNMTLRQFLKEVGVTSQREIEIAVREAVRTRRLTGTETLAARALITIDAVGLRHEVTADIGLE
jgi:Family of unknown function (DUF6494)